MKLEYKLVLAAFLISQIIFFTLKLINSETKPNSYWQLEVPENWISVPQSDGQYAYKNESGDKMIYLAVHEITKTQTINNEFAQYVIGAKKECYDVYSPDSSFALLDEKIYKKNGYLIGYTDIYSEKNKMRIFTKAYIKEGVVLTFSFHDYLCRNLKDTFNEYSQINGKLKVNF